MLRRTTSLAVVLVVVLVSGGPAWTSGGVGDLRGATLTLTPTDTGPAVTVTSPNGGESWPAGTWHNITWTSANSIADTIRYTTNGGQNWFYVGEQTPPTTRTSVWHVPNTQSSNCRVLVSAADSWTVVVDVSDSVFTIAPPDTSWTPQPSIPEGPRDKTVKAGGCTASDALGNLCLLKGNNTTEFYRYDAALDTWHTGDSIPLADPDGKKRRVKKGASMAVAGGSVYVLKGGSSTELWRYDPGVCTGTGTWVTVQTVPVATYSCQATATINGSTYIYKIAYDRKSKTTDFSRFTTPNGPVVSLSAPGSGPSGKSFSTGSCIVYYPDDITFGKPRIFALQLKTNEFYSYDIAGGTWSYLNTLSAPWPGTRGNAKKVGAGAGMAYVKVGSGQAIFALKGGNTQEVWTYKDGGAWTSFDTVPRMPSNKKVKDGGGIAYASGVLYIVKGNNTNDNYAKQLTSLENLSPVLGADVQSASSNSEIASGLAVLPNPSASSFNPSISYSLPRAGDISLKLYDATGKLVGTLVSGYRPAGTYAWRLSPAACRLSAGVYLLKLESGGCNATNKLIIE